MARFTKKLRQQIIEDFSRQNNGWYDPAAFVAYVKTVGSDHPAYEWFEWDDAAAGEKYRLDQARSFASGLRVKFEVKTVKRGPVKLVQQTAPLLTSPIDKRRHGGGYYVTDANDAEHVEELCKQAARDLGWMVRRHAVALAHVGADTKQLSGVIAKLEAATGKLEAA